MVQGLGFRAQAMPQLCYKGSGFSHILGRVSQHFNLFVSVFYEARSLCTSRGISNHLLDSCRIMVKVVKGASTKPQIVLE